MFFRYWKEDGKATVIEEVDRLVFDSLTSLQFRRFVSGRYIWDRLRYGLDYLQFTMSED
jgi:hypothetical protein